MKDNDSIGFATSLAELILSKTSKKNALGTLPFALGCGTSSLALFFFTMHSLKPLPAYKDLYELCLELSLKSSLKTIPSLSLFGGYSGVSWAFDACKAPLPNASKTSFRRFDHILLNQLIHTKNVQFDLTDGLLGFCLGRGPELQQAELLMFKKKLRSNLKSRMIRTQFGLAVGGGINVPNKHVDLGLAHGPISFLQLRNILYPKKTCDKTISKIEKSVFTTQMKAAHFFKNRGLPYSSLEPNRSRSGWCYGNPGVGTFLALLGLRTKNEVYVKAGIEIFNHFDHRGLAFGRIPATNFCHGSSGIAYLYWKMGVAFQNSHYLDEHRRWRKETFRRLPQMNLKKMPLKKLINILSGPLGTALALLAADEIISPEWDSLLLLSDPAGRQ
jgi:hypothetical protein